MCRYQKAIHVVSNVKNQEAPHVVSNVKNSSANESESFVVDSLKAHHRPTVTLNRIRQAIHSTLQNVNFILSWFQTKAAAISIALLWDCLIPQLTWVHLCALFYAPPRYRPVFFFLYLLPTFCPPLPRALVKVTDAMFRSIAEKKGMVVVPSTMATTSTSSGQKTTAIGPSNGNPTIYGFHPHNKYPMDIMPLLASSSLFQDSVLAQGSAGNFMPTIGYITMLFGRVVDATRWGLEGLLRCNNNKKSIALFPGGHREMIHLVPFSNEIHIVKHGGFLRLAKSVPGTTVTPCFIFHFADSHLSPWPKFDKVMYETIGFSFPNWYPSFAAASPLRMVVGEALEPSRYETEEALEAAYYSALKQLFEVNKGRHGGSAYAQRSLVFLDPPSRKPKTQRKWQITPVCSIAFSVVTFLILLFTGAFWKFTTWEFYEKNSLESPFRALNVHIGAACGWAFATLAHRANPKNRIASYLSAIAMLFMVGSAKCLSLGLVIKNPTSFHSMFHCLSNLQVSSISMHLFAYSMIAIIGYKRKKEHRKYMRALDGFLLINFLPRITGALARWIFSAWGISGEASFSLACLVQITWQLKILLTGKQSQLKSMYLRLNALSFVLSICVAAIVIGFEQQRVNTAMLSLLMMGMVTFVALMDAKHALTPTPGANELQASSTR